MMFGRNKGIDVVLPHLPDQSVGIEVGVWRGDSSEKLLTKARVLHLVDPWSVTAYEESDEFGDYDAYLDRYSKLVGSKDPLDFQKYYDGVYETVVQRFSQSPVYIHRKISVQFFSEYQGMADWIYLDGSHSHEGCLNDLRESVHVAPRVFGDDYCVKPGVTSAVNQFVEEAGRSLLYLGDGQYRIL